MTSNWTQRIRQENYPTYALPRTSNRRFTPASVCDQSFSSNGTIYDFPLTLMLNFKVPHICLKLGRLLRKLTVCTPPLHGRQCPHRMKTLRGEAFRNVQSYIVLCYYKNQSAIPFLIFGRSPIFTDTSNLYLPMTKTLVMIGPKLWKN